MGIGPKLLADLTSWKNPICCYSPSQQKHYSCTLLFLIRYLSVLHEGHLIWHVLLLLRRLIRFFILSPNGPAFPQQAAFWLSKMELSPDSSFTLFITAVSKSQIRQVCVPGSSSLLEAWNYLINFSHVRISQPTSVIFFSIWSRIQSYWLVFRHIHTNIPHSINIISKIKTSWNIQNLLEHYHSNRWGILHLNFLPDYQESIWKRNNEREIISSSLLYSGSWFLNMRSHTNT